MLYYVHSLNCYKSISNFLVNSEVAFVIYALYAVITWSILYTAFAICYTIRFALSHRRHSSDAAWKQRNLVCGGEQNVYSV